MEIEITKQGILKIEGGEYPAVGFGTSRLKEESCERAVRQALEAGYRILDTAAFYENFIPIGKVLKSFDRSQLYLISKVWPHAQTKEGLRADLHAALTQLQTAYLDGYLLHFPNCRIPIEETLQEMDAFKKEKRVRHIGMCNVTSAHLKRALEVGIPLEWVQIEMHPQFFDEALFAFCRKHSISMQAWAPLGRGRLAADPFLAKIGENYGKTASQVAIRWVLQHGCLPLPKSQNRDHLMQNREVFDFALSKSEMEAIDQRAKAGERERITQEKGFGFTDEFDFAYEQCWPKSAQS